MNFGMSPYPGEEALPLAFGITFAVIGGLIALYLVVRMTQEYRLRRKVNADRPDPLKFKEYPELQAIVDQYYLLRYHSKQRAAREQLDAQARDASLARVDLLIEEGLLAAERLRVATTPDTIAAARQEVSRITRELEVIAGIQAPASDTSSSQ